MQLIDTIMWEVVAPFGEQLTTSIDYVITDTAHAVIGMGLTCLIGADLLMECPRTNIRRDHIKYVVS